MILLAVLVIVIAGWINHIYLCPAYRNILRGVHGDPDEEIS
jgi:hypothetical protein